jgi:methylase of polypeptide subunit release factors
MTLIYKTLELPKSVSTDDNDKKQRHYLYLAYAVIAAWIQLTQKSTLLSDYLSNISSLLILDSKEIVHALSILPDNQLIDFITWFHNCPKEELQAIVKQIQSYLSDPVFLFNMLGTQLFDEEELNQHGAIFTPNWLAFELTQKTLQYWKQLNPEKESPKLVGDLSCGPGAFLFYLSNLLTNTSHIIGVDRNIELACLARLMLICRPNCLIESKDTLLDIQKQSSLFSSASNIPSFDYDILVGNPPYIRSQTLPSMYTIQLKQLYPTFTRGNFDLVVLFLAHTLEALAHGGVGGLIVSNKFMSSRYGASICRRLAEQARILEIVNFGDGQVFSNRTTYTCTITFAKLPKSKSFFVTSFPHGLDWHGDNAHSKLAQKTELPSSRLLSHPWNLANESKNEIVKLMHEPGLPSILDIFRNICQGVRTGANQIFLINQEAAAHIEPELLQPHVNGQNIRRGYILPSDYYLLHPYRFNMNGLIEVIPPDILERDFPGAWAYLLCHREALTERKLNPELQWYSYSRTQNLAIQHYPKILVKEMMPRAEFAADPYGEFATSAGYALVARPEMTSQELEFWAAILSTPIMEFQLRMISTQLHSGWFRLLGHHLKKIKLPVLQGQDYNYANKLVDNLRQDTDNDIAWNQLDNLVAKSFKLTSEMQEEIRIFLHQAHTASISTSINQTQQNVNIETNRDTSYSELSDEQRQLYIPVELSQFNQFHRYREDLRQLVTFVPNKTTPIHRWYDYTQGYSSLLIKKLVEELGIKKTETVYDPFVGSGTTLLTCRTIGVPAFGLEISPFMAWVASLKINPWNSQALRNVLDTVKKAQPKPKSPEKLLFFEYLQRAYSPAVLEQLVGWRDWICNLKCEPEHRDFLMLALVSIIEEVSYIRKHGSHYRYLNKDEDESVGLKKLNIPLISQDADIKPIFVIQIEKMINDINMLPFSSPFASCRVLVGDARQQLESIETADAVITSPPYLNRNNYIAQQKAELSLLNLLPSYEEYKHLVQSTFRSHVESNLGAEPQTTIPEVMTILEAFKLSVNNNPKIPHMIAGYFEDLKDTLNVLFNIVKPGGRLAFVVGNCRWGGVIIPVDHLIGLLAERRGFTVERILVTRLKGNSPQQMHSYGRISVRESIVIFKRPN